MRKVLKKLIISIFLLLLLLLLYIILFKTDQVYILKRESVNISKILVIALDLIFIFLYVVLVQRKDISIKRYYVLLTIIQALFLIIQLTILLNIRFDTSWDVESIRNAVNTYIKNGSITNNDYLTKYPNNLLLVGILSVLAKLPLIGKYYLTTLIFNTLIVNLSVLFISLSVKNFHSNKAGILVYIFLIPLILLNPWFIIPYSDTFALFFISIITYIYSKKEKDNKDIFLIIFLSIFGAFIKPMVIIPLISIIICEFIYKDIIITKDYKKYITIILSIIVAILIKDGFINILHFTPVKDKYSTTVFHFLAMGQNPTTSGFYNYMDEMNSYNLGYKYDINQFKKRFKINLEQGQLKFITNKILISFGDGSFAWGLYGTFFPEIESIKNPKNIFQEIYYEKGKYYNNYLNTSNLIWFCLLLFLPFILLKGVNKNELFLVTSFIGIFLFILIFETCSRYLYCFSGILIVITFLAINKIYDILKN